MSNVKNAYETVVVFSLKNGEEAVSALSSALWGYTARDSLRICRDFLDW